MTKFFNHLHPSRHLFTVCTFELLSTTGSPKYSVRQSTKPLLAIFFKCDQDDHFFLKSIRHPLLTTFYVLKIPLLCCWRWMITDIDDHHIILFRIFFNSACILSTNPPVKIVWFLLKNLTLGLARIDRTRKETEVGCKVKWRRIDMIRFLAWDTMGKYGTFYYLPVFPWWTLINNTKQRAHKTQPTVTICWIKYIRWSATCYTAARTKTNCAICTKCTRSKQCFVNWISVMFFCTLFLSHTSTSNPVTYIFSTTKSTQKYIKHIMIYIYILRCHS